MAKLTPNIPYDDLGDSCQIAEYHAAWAMESSEESILCNLLCPPILKF
jgi:hypothetical protein